MKQKYFYRRLHWPKTGAIYGISLFVVVFSLLSDRFFSVTNFSNILNQSAVLCMITICSFLAIVTHQTDLSVGAVSGFAAIVAAVAIAAGYSVFVSCVLAIVAAMLIGVCNGVLAGHTKIPTFIITLATMSIAESLGMVLHNGTIRITAESFGALSSTKIWVMPLPAIFVLILYCVLHYIMKHRRLGTSFYAVGGHEEAALTSGIHVKRMKLYVYMINGALAGFAGILYSARLGSANPSQGLGLELDGICSAVLGGAALTGGRGSAFGALLGAIAISVLRNGMNILGWRTISQMMVIGAVLIIILGVDVLWKGGEGK